VSKQPDIPAPAVMPLADREAWHKQLSLSNFVNSFYQLRDVESLDAGRRMLIIGPGQGLDTQIFRWRGYEVTTFDIDEAFGPDVVGSVHDLSMFGNGQFDVAVASHVVEHVAPALLDTALSEIARVAGHALIYLPVAGRPVHLRFVPHITPIDASVVIDVFNFLDAPDGVTPKYCEGQHFWEIGRRGWSRRAVRARLSVHFDVVREYRNYDWVGSYNFVLRSKKGAAQ
jgi:SAM-dependent methyltransferase